METEAACMTKNHYICQYNGTGAIFDAHFLQKRGFRRPFILYHESNISTIMHLTSKGNTFRNIHLLALTLCVMASCHATAQIDHPTLIFTPSVVDKAKQAVSNDSIMASHWHELQKKADSYT